MAKEGFSSSINGDKSRRNSLAGSANSRGRPPSLYRRASISTCHDFCKPGKKHESEGKARLPLPKRITKKPLVEPNLYEISDSTQRKKASAAVGSKSLPRSEIHITAMSEVTKLRTSTGSSGGNKPMVNKLLSTKEKASVVMLKTKPSPNSRSHTSDIINLEVPMNSSDGKVSRENKNKTMRKLQSSSDAGKVMQHKGSLPSRRVQLSLEKVPSKANEECFHKQPATSLKLKSQAGKPLPAVPFDVRRRNGSSDMKTGKTSATSKLALEVVSASHRASLFRRASLPGAISPSARKNRSLKLVDEHVESDSDILEEKTLYVIKLETENVVLESDKNENCAAQDESEYTVTEANHDSDSAFIETGGIPRKDWMFFSDYNDLHPAKLSFRMGKVVDIQSNDNYSRQLKFRQGSVLGEDQDSTTEGHITFTREVDGYTDDKETGEGKVVLRHQDVLEKQDGKGLFNSIIKETANKLAETRKSKVKALVGAFETVISLQETKDSSNTVSE